MNNLYIDFDNTIVESNKKVIEILNKRYSLNKTEENLIDYNFKSIHPVKKDEIIEIFECEDFFLDLEFKSGFLEFANELKDKVTFNILTKGTSKNLEMKKKWLDENFPYKFNFIGLRGFNFSKKKSNIKNGFQIDDCVESLDTHAKIKILYKDNHNYYWQKKYTNKDILVVNNWNEILDIVLFYLKYDYRTLKEM